MDYQSLYDMLPLAKEGQMVLGLETMERLMAILDHPEEKVKVIHIAGTNGKGSTASFLRSILSEAGYRVGLFTSPSLVDFNERIQIDGRPLSDQELMALAQTIKKQVEGVAKDLSFTEFELFTALAYLFFFENDCDFAIMEVGLGGRLDATNVVKEPILTMITKIALDHQAILGNSLEAIAGEKAGIIKDQVPLILYPQVTKGVQKVILDKAKQHQAPVYPLEVSDLTYQLNTQPGLQSFNFKGQVYEIALLEAHQIKNAAMAIEGAELLAQLGYPVGNQAIKAGLVKTQWPARFEVLQKDPPIIIDGSHNVDGITELQANIMRYFPQKKRVGIIGMLADKDVLGALRIILPTFDYLITVTPPNKRAMKASVLKDLIEELDLLPPGAVANSESLEEAYQKGLALAEDEEGILCIFGSTYYVGLMRQLIRKKRE